MKDKQKRFQELRMSYRIAIWLRWMPIGYAKALGWYFVKRLKWEDVSDDDKGRISMGTCIGICLGTVQANMRWYYTSEEVFAEDGTLIERKHGPLKRIGNFIEDKFVELIDGKSPLF